MSFNFGVKYDSDITAFVKFTLLLSRKQFIYWCFREIISFEEAIRTKNVTKKTFSFQRTIQPTHERK